MTPLKRIFLNSVLLGNVFLWLLTCNCQADQRFLYRFTKPLETPSKLNGPIRLAHVGGEIGGKFIKFYGAFQALNMPSFFGLTPLETSILWVGAEAITMPLNIMIQSAGHLKIQTMYKTSKKLNSLQQEFEKLPAVRNLNVLSTATFTWDRFIAKSIVSKGFVFMETAKPLESGELQDRALKALEADMGNPVQIKNPASARLKLRLYLGAEEALYPTEWEAPILDIFSQKPVSQEVLQEWKSTILDKARDKNFLSRMSGQATGKIKITMSLLEKGKPEELLGTFVEGPTAKKLLGLTFSQRMLSKIRRASDTTIPLIQRVAGTDGKLFEPKFATQDPYRCMDHFNHIFETHVFENRSKIN